MNDMIKNMVYDDKQIDFLIEEQLVKRGISHEDFLNILKEKIGGEEQFENVMINGINKATHEYYKRNIEYLNYLTGLSIEQLKSELVKSQSESLKHLFIYHFILARDAYDHMFKNFKKLVSKPEFFFTALIDSLYLDFNVELFVCSRKFDNCKGFIFNLEDGYSHNHKMGIVLTQNAFLTIETFFNTLFHELSHRLHYARLCDQNENEDRVSHEFNAYFFDKFLQHFYFRDIGESKWLSDVFGYNLFELADKIESKNPDYFDTTIDKFRSDLDRMYDRLKNNYDPREDYYTYKTVEKMYFRASKAGQVPRNYRSIIDFLWFYSSRLSVMLKLNFIDLEKLVTTLFIVLILFSRKYEFKYHDNSTVVYNNISFHPIGDLKEYEIDFINRYCSRIVDLEGNISYGGCKHEVY